MTSLISSSIRNTLALLVTVGLFSIMMSLVVRPLLVIETPTPKIIDVVWVPKTVTPAPPEPIEPVTDPLPPPPTTITNPSEVPIINDENIFVQLGHEPNPAAITIVPPDGALASVVTVAPAYPPAAMRRGLEGYCTVEFVVTPAGTTRDVTVVESACSSSIFWKASVQAAQKFKYAPERVNGVAVASYGVRKLFTYKLE